MATKGGTIAMVGKTISHYRILEKLGEGGMGVVYKAEDTKLGRMVALKVLPPERVADPNRKRRFVQEARAASALNHPNIITIYDIDEAEGVQCIAMEYVEGKTLDRLIARHGLRVNEALKYAVQIAAALAKAHSGGIVHRDLKPTNVMVSDDGLVKVLDFGLAKLTEVPPVSDTETAVTQKPKTEEGTIVGTVGYMSPEQAEGKAVDARSDIFSFGSVLYEMLTGQRAFQGETKASTIATILREEPKPLSQVVEGLPREVERLVKRCLRKDPAHRFQHMDDLKVALEELKEELDSGELADTAPVAPGYDRRDHRAALRRLIALAAIAVIAVALAVMGWLRPNRRGGRQQEAPMREVPLTGDPGSEVTPSFSPDGSEVVFAAVPPDYLRTNLVMKQIGVATTRQLTDCQEMCGYSVWSPDGQWIAFGRWTTTGEEQRVPILLIPRIGGAERKIADTYQLAFPDRFVAWMPDNKCLVTADKDDPEGAFNLVLVSVETGEKRRLTSPPKDSFGDSGPAISPDGRVLAFSRHLTWGASDLYLLDLTEDMKPRGEPRRLASGVPNANCPVWTPDGNEIVFCSHVWHDATMWRIRADGSGRATPLPFGGRGAYFPVIAPKGNRLSYVKHVWNTNIWRAEMQGFSKVARPPEKFIPSKLLDNNPAYSPDGRTIAFASDRSGSIQIWLCDNNGTNLRQLTSMNSTWGMVPVWSPDGEWIAFWSDEEGNREIYVVNAQGGTPRRLTNNPANDQHPVWSHDGQWIFFNSDRTGEWKVWKVRRDGGDAVLAEKTTLGAEDPDGRFTYFVKDTEGALSLWRVPVEGGKETKVLDSMAREDFQLTRQGIYYIASHTARGAAERWSLAWYDLATGKEIDIAPVPLGMGNGLTVSPDGRFILYTQKDHESSDLMLVENFH